MTLSATGCLFLLIWRSFDPKCREFPLLGVKNGWDWPSLEWQGGCMTLSTRNTILTLSDGLSLQVTQWSSWQSAGCTASVTRASCLRESLLRETGKKRLQEELLGRETTLMTGCQSVNETFDVESQRLELIETLQDLNDHIILRLISSLSYFIAHWLDLLRWYRLPN